jgi:prepilin-type processing-associated H-X9-DG protein
VNEQVPPTPTKVASRTTIRIFAVIGLLIGTILLVSLALPRFGPGRDTSEMRCLSNLHHIGLAIGLYADEHSGKIPQAFDDLRPYADNLDRLLICPSAKDNTTPSYQILLGGQKWGDQGTSKEIAVTELAKNHRFGSNALYGDGHVEFLRDRPSN